MLLGVSFPTRCSLWQFSIHFSPLCILENKNRCFLRVSWISSWDVSFSLNLLLPFCSDPAGAECQDLGSSCESSAASQQPSDGWSPSRGGSRGLRGELTYLPEATGLPGMECGGQAQSPVTDAKKLSPKRSFLIWTQGVRDVDRPAKPPCFCGHAPWTTGARSRVGCVGTRGSHSPARCS